MKGGIAAMQGTRYRKGKHLGADLTVYARMMAQDNGSQLHQLRRNLVQAMEEELTQRQKQVLFLYYEEGLNMREIGQLLGVDRSTVSRTLKRGEARLQRCLRYGGAALLRGTTGEEGKEAARRTLDKRCAPGRF